jgi:AraC family transcriptional regulator
MQETERPQDVVSTRAFGPLSMMEIAQGAGSFPDNSAPVFNLQLMMSANCEGEFGYAGHQFQSWINCGDIFLAPASCDCNYVLSASHAFLMIPIPLMAVKAVTEHLMPSFGGDFSRLHSNKFRSDGLRKRILNLWRGAGREAQTSSLDVHGQAMVFIEDLLRLAVDPSALRKVRHHLSPHARQRVLDYIDAHLAEDVSLPKLAQVAGLSEYYFMRAFKAEMGITGHQYVLQQRIYRAIRLLRVTKTPIAQIALGCGFNDQAHLAHTFARLCGYPPSALRIKIA